MIRKAMLFLFVAVLAVAISSPVMAQAPDGAFSANGWYEGEEIYYLDQGIEEGVTEKGVNQIYLIGDNRLHQAQVVLLVPGEPGYSPHWNVNVVHTATGKTVADLVGYAPADSVFNGGSEPVLFDDAKDIMAAEAAGLVTIEKPGVVVLCPIVSEEAAEAPGVTELGITDPFTEEHLDEGF